MSVAKKKAKKFVGCTIKRLPGHLQEAAAAEAVRQNPMNRPLMAFAMLPEQKRIAVTSTWFRSGSVDLTVWFMENTRQDLQSKILGHCNAWGQRCNVQFRAATSQAASQVRISRKPGGYWSYLGTDILSVPTNEPTMNLEGFVLATPDSEYRRVVRHETGHTLGCPHEHSRREIVSLLDPAKVIAFFERTQGWSEQDIRDQILTPLDEQSIRGTPHAEQDSIMCYDFPAAVTISGKAIPGGMDITEDDYAFMATVYPKQAPPPPPPAAKPAKVIAYDAAGKTLWSLP